MMNIRSKKYYDSQLYSTLITFFFMIFIIFLIYTSNNNYILFKGIVKAIEIFVGIGVSVIILNTYKLNIKSIFTIIGISYIFISFFNLLCILSYNETSFIGYDNHITFLISISKRYLESISMFLTFIYLGKKIKIKTITMFYFIISLIIVFFILNIEKIPHIYLEKVFSKGANIAVHIILIFIIFLGIFTLGKKAKQMDKDIYNLLLNFLILQVIANLALIVSTNDFDIFNNLYYIFRLVSYYLIYKAIIKGSLKEPYKKLMEREKRYKSLIELLSDGVVMAKGGNIVYCNESFINLLGYESKYVIGKNIKEFVHSGYHNNIDRNITEIKENHNPIIVQEKLKASNGNDIDVEVKLSVINLENEVYEIAIIKDIKDRIRSLELSSIIKKEEELLNQAIENEKNRTMLFSSVSHELKTPLNIILGSTQLIEKTHQGINNCPYSERLIRNTKIMKQNCYRLLRLINNLIDFNKLENGFYNLDITNNNIISIIEDITMSVIPYCETKNIDIIFDTDLEERIIACDPIKIERIILNLLSNAIKFTRVNGCIWVTVSNSKDKVIISVKDNGIGIPKDKQNSVFESFTQIHPSIDSNYGGSGIGLSLVKALVEAHEGEVYINNEYNDGVEFIIELKGRKILDIEKTNKEVASSKDGLVERINIEFSDIYSINI